MSIKSFLFFLLAGITFSIVLLLGLFNEVSVGTIIKRLFVYSLLIGGCGFLLGYLIEHWGQDLDLEGMKSVGQSFDSFGMQKGVSEEDSSIGNSFTDHTKEINPFSPKSGQKLKIDPQVAAKAIQKVMHEDDE